MIDNDDDQEDEEDEEEEGNSNEDSDDDKNSEDGDEEEAEDSKPDNYSQHFDIEFKSEEIRELDETFTQNRTVHRHNWPVLGNVSELCNNKKIFNVNNLDKKPLTKVEEFQLKNPLHTNISGTLTSFQKEIFTILNSYKSLLYTGRTFENGEELRYIYCLHALNHILKTRARIITHNKKLSAGQTGDYRDQGLTRPKVLIIVPFRDSAKRIVECLSDMLFSKDSETNKKSVMNLKRFNNEFGQDPNDSGPKASKPEDYRNTFVGNTSDDFRIGLAITKKTIKLYSDFYSSDIIIASPLGLRMAVGAEGESSHDHDFLSSIEVTILDQSEIFLMQNWESVQMIINFLHLRPKKDHNIDYSRVKNWVLELWSKYYHQLVVFSSVPNLFIKQLLLNSQNYSGIVFPQNSVPKSEASISKILLPIPQHFHRITDLPLNLTEIPDERFKYFTTQLLPKLRDKSYVRTLIYIPSYFDFVRMRNYFRKEDIGFTQLSEYSEEGKIAKARHIFFYGGRQFMLVTGRFHFFHRKLLKGIRHIVFYEPPIFYNFYSELISMMHQNNQGKKLFTDYLEMSVTTLCTQQDQDILDHILGSEIVKKILFSRKSQHTFVINSK